MLAGYYFLRLLPIFEYKNIDGTDGQRLRSHQCSFTSIPPPVSSLNSSNCSSNTSLMVPVPFLCRLAVIGIQVPLNRATRFLLSSGLWCSVVLSRTRNHCAKLLTITASPTRRFDELFVPPTVREPHKCIFLYSNAGVAFLSCSARMPQHITVHLPDARSLTASKAGKTLQQGFSPPSLN